MLYSGYILLHQFNPESNSEDLNTILTQDFNTVAFMSTQWDVLFLTNLHGL